MKRFVLISAVLALAACSSPTVVKEKIIHVNVPVVVPCKVAEDPPTVRSLKEEFSAEQWASLTPQQKAALVARQGLRHQNDGMLVRANSAACPTA